MCTLYQSDQGRIKMEIDGLCKCLASVAQLDAPSNWRPGGHGFNPRQGRQHSFMEIDREIFSMVILSLLLIQKVVSYWRKNVHNTGEPLKGLSLPSKRVVR